MTYLAEPEWKGYEKCLRLGGLLQQILIGLA